MRLFKHIQILFLSGQNDSHQAIKRRVANTYMYLKLAFMSNTAPRWSTYGLVEQPIAKTHSLIFDHANFPGLHVNLRAMQSQSVG